MTGMLLILIGYLSGSICSAVIISRLFSLPDPRSKGSKNPGATNVLRLSGKKYALLVLVADAVKGLLPVLLAKALGADYTVLSLICLAAVTGHMYPVFFGFKGGKGVATALGALLGLHFMLGVAVIAIWLLIARFGRYSSLASIGSMLFMPLIAILMLSNLKVFLPLFFMALLILYKHRGNVTRLIDGEEPKIKFSKGKLADIFSQKDVLKSMDQDLSDPTQSTATHAHHKKSAEANHADKEDKT